MESLALSLLLVVLMVGVFDFTNGYHDAADMAAIASHAMGPATAQPAGVRLQQQHTIPCFPGPARPVSKAQESVLAFLAKPGIAALFKGCRFPEAGAYV